MRLDSELFERASFNLHSRLEIFGAQMDLFCERMERAQMKLQNLEAMKCANSIALAEGRELPYQPGDFFNL